MLANSGIISFLPMILVFVVFYFLLIRPQQAKQRELRAQLAGLRRGDRVQTSGGIIGVVQATRDGAKEIEIEIAPGIRVQCVRDAVTVVLSSSAKPANDLAKAKK
ncbi:preprotein translocase subunit YajC [Neoasaia chiangmaiensis]|uniref:Sec translocon accessory complex subunit YajC n=2 Tax=Neoasaia chiangmaiensis TaxID=320497 RepID=A0A1U9KUC9_9PROT|nr:preprotein translocase subunit YajC [Neoasaia chiangmaiensis]AQS89454.1 preprotein translocase subunit YajC [Neoasaia chiangmaiensis]